MAKNKLAKVNVPELFYIHFLKDLTATPGSVLELIHGITPSARGRGFSRVIPEVTQAQYDELYELGMNARAAMSGGVDRETVLRAAICAKAMCERMEAAGVSNPQPFVPKRATKVKTTAAPVTTVTTDGATVNALNTMADDATDEPDTNLNSIVPAEPATLDTADDLEEVSDEELDGFGADIGFG
jgi:hypothetical protein